MYEVWLVGNRRLEKYRYPRVSTAMLRELAKNRADIVADNGRVKVVVWSDREVSPIQEMEVGGDEEI